MAPKVRILVIRHGTVINIKEDIEEGDPLMKRRVDQDIEYFVDRGRLKDVKIGDVIDPYYSRVVNSFSAEPTIWAMLRDICNRLRAEENPPKPPYTDNEWAFYAVEIIRAAQPVDVPVPIFPGFPYVEPHDEPKASAATPDQPRKLKRRRVMY